MHWHLHITSKTKRLGPVFRDVNYTKVLFPNISKCGFFHKKFEDFSIARIITIDLYKPSWTYLNIELMTLLSR